jgi:hypothetical protein
MITTKVKNLATFIFSLFVLFHFIFLSLFDTGKLLARMFIEQ